MSKTICIIGSGGFAKEVYWLLKDCGMGDQVECFMEPDDLWVPSKQVLGLPVKKQSELNPSAHKVVLGIGDPVIRQKVVYEQLPAETDYPVLIHPSVKMSEWVRLERGTVICAGTIITCDITIGEFATINLCCTIGHDTHIGRFFTANPSSNISGDCTIGDFVFIGTNASVRDDLRICDHVTVGMGGVVVKSIEVSGVYVGSPAKKLG